MYFTQFRVLGRVTAPSKVKKLTECSIFHQKPSVDFEIGLPGKRGGRRQQPCWLALHSENNLSIKRDRFNLKQERAGALGAWS
jgi:hypothetical protein